MCIIAFIALIDGLMTWWGNYLNIDGFTLEMVLGYLLYPVSFLLGVSRHGDDIYRVAQLIGLKLIGSSFPQTPFAGGYSPLSFFPFLIK